MRQTYIIALLAAIYFSTSAAHADDAIKPEPLAKPRAVAPVVPNGGKPIYFYPRVSRYEVWQNLGVSRAGRWRPLVIQGPYGAFYRYNLEPFPWTYTHSGSVIPNAVD